MKLTAQVKLSVTAEQAEALRRTMQAANACCDRLSAWAWENRTFAQFPLHRARYAAERAESGLTAQVVVRCIGKTADAYKLDRRTRRTFQPLGSIAFDDRVLNWYMDKGQVSIWTVDGRLRLPFVCGDYQRGLLAYRQGESDLCLVGGNFYLLATVSLPDPPLVETDGVIGVDLGVVNLAVDSDGEVHTGAGVSKCRRRFLRLRQGLQSCGSKRARRRLGRARRKESRYQRWLNHNISKHLVTKALAENKALAIEDLKGINGRTTVRKPQRYERLSWAFHQLRQFLAYKCHAAGVPLFVVPAAYTSQTCPACGHCARSNRRNQSEFLCRQCGFRANADWVGATNVRRRGLEARGTNVRCPLVGAAHGLCPEA